MNNQKRSGLWSGILVLSVAGLLVKVCGFLYKVPLYGLLLEEMANVNGAYSIYTVLYTLSTAGIPTGIAVITAEAEARGESKVGILRGARRMLLWVGFLGTVLLLLFARPISLWNSGGDTYLCLLAIAPSLFFVSLSSVYRGAFQGEGNMVPIAFSQLWEALGKMGIGLGLAFLALRRFGLGKREAAALSVLGITLGIALGCIYLVFRGRTLFSGEKTSSSQRMLLSISLPIMLSSLLMNLSSLADSQLMRPLLSRYFGDRELAKAVFSDYSTGALTLCNLPTVLIYPITCATVPRVSSAHILGQDKKRDKYIEGAFRMSSVISLPFSAVFATLGTPILDFVFWGNPGMAKNAGILLAYLAPSVFLAGLLHVSSSVLQACHKQNKPILSVLLGGGVKILSSFILIPKIGPLGAPLGTVFSLAVSCSVNLYFVMKDLGFLPKIGKLFFRPFASGMLSGGVGYGFFRIFSQGMGKNALLPGLSLAIPVFFFSAVKFGGLEREDFDLLPGTKKLGQFLEKAHLWGKPSRR